MMGTSGAPKRSIRPPRQRAKVPGWASFDAQQRGGVPKADVDPFPSFPPTSSSSNHLQRKPSQGSVMDKNYLKEKNDVSAVVRHENISFISPNSRGKPWKGFSQLIGKVAVRPEKLIDPYPNAILASTAMLQGVTDDANQKKVAVEKLKALYGWADESLIDDVLVAVNYELEQASASLESMAVMTLPENSDPSDASEAVENSLPDQSSEGTEGSGPLLPESLGFENLHVTVARGHMPTAPPEPEWEEDDVYLKHRKEALRMRRAANRHSREAERAYLRGDHSTARNISLKSKEEHLAADKLNAKAAAEILQIRNEKHKDIWKLDLHGLHAAEAVQALELRLEMIEYNTSAPSGPGTNQQSNFNTEQQSSGLLSLRTWRPSELQVITGVGVHSRGGAALPIAIKNFLIDKGYKFSEARAGVIAVRPKFRYN